jgi:hypothetical protein
MVAGLPAVLWMRQPHLHQSQRSYWCHRMGRNLFWRGVLQVIRWNVLCRVDTVLVPVMMSREGNEMICWKKGENPRVKTVIAAPRDTKWLNAA